MHVQDFDRQDFPVLLAAQDIDASDGALFAEEAKLKPNTTHRTIFIGLGGTGVQTLDRIKGVVSNRLDATWKNYIAFLAIDTAYTELDKTKYLQKSETVLTTLAGADTRVKFPEQYPAAWRMFAKPETMAKEIHGMALPGAGRERLIGRLKVHDQNAQGAVDMKIVQAIAGLKSNVLSPVGAPGNYEVYVVGSVCGGTCSGAFLEMPALVHKALNCNNVHIYALLYLPDTLTHVDPANAAQLMANGYASLKELNYYQGVSMRPGYPEIFSYNDPAAPELKIVEGADMDKVSGVFYDIPYLIGTSSGAAANSSEVARQNISEFLISLLGKVTVTGDNQFVTDDFLSNALMKLGVKNEMAGVPDREAAGTFHEFPRHYGAIGFAQTAAPKKIVRSYVVSKACEEAGLKPVSADKRAELLAGDPHAFLPFRDEDDLLNAREGTQKALEIVAPLDQLLQLIHTAEFSFLQATGWPADDLWKKLSKQEYETGAMPARLTAAFDAKTNVNAMKALEEAMVRAYGEYLENVKRYVSEEGPLAFHNLFVGRFVPVNGDSGSGIHAMLRNIQAGIHANGNAYSWENVATAKAELDTREQAVTSAGLLHRTKVASQWVPAYDNWQKARIIEKRREFALGDTGKFHEKVLYTATVLAEQIQAFGYLLVSLSDIYKKHGNALDNFNDFSTARENEVEINLCAVSEASHSWLKKQAEAQLLGVNAKRIRSALVDNFFANIEGWVSVPENTAVKTNGVTKLVREGVAIPARKLFDEVLKNEVPDTLQLDIEKTFTAINEAGTDYATFADQVVQSLALASGLMFNGTVDESDYYRYLMYPSALKSSAEGTAIARAIEIAAQNRFGAIAVYASDDADSIKIYQLAAPFEVYRLNDLKVWEDNYFAINDKDKLLHGASPDADKLEAPGQAPRYIENTSWKDYPSIVPSAVDPKVPDPVTGIISYEGQIRIKLAEMIKRARALGVLYCKHENERYRVYRVNCDKSRTWTLELFNLGRNELGLLPVGAELAGIIAAENGTTLDAISKPVELNQGGVLMQPHITEAAAWEYTERVLRTHVPMQAEVRRTVAKFEEWYKIIEAENTKIMERLKPAKMIFMIRARMLYSDEAGMWKIKLGNGTEKTVANLSDSGLQMLEMTDPKGARFVRNGFSAYFIYTKLAAMNELKGESFDRVYNAARERLTQLGDQGDQDTLMAGLKMASFMDEEIKTIDTVGGALGDGEDANLREAFIGAMQEKQISDSAAMKDIRTFYVRASKWNMM